VYFFVLVFSLPVIFLVLVLIFHNVLHRPGF
jgi:hypothetical protein